MWYRSKTIWTGLAACVGAGGAWASGEMNGVQALQMVVTGILGIFLKLAVEKVR